MGVTVKNEDTREDDLLSCTDYDKDYGGLIVSVKTLQAESPLA